MFRNDPRLSKQRHKIGVAIPSWHNVQVDVALNPRAADSSEVHTDVKALGAHRFPEYPNPEIGQPEKVKGHLIRKLFQCFHVAVRSHQQVAAVIRKQVHDDKPVTPPMEEEIGLVTTLTRLRAEDTATGLVGLLDVGHAPGCPDDLHGLR